MTDEKTLRDSSKGVLSEPPDVVYVPPGQEIQCRWCDRYYHSGAGLALHEKHCLRNPKHPVKVKAESTLVECPVCGRRVRQVDLQKHQWIKCRGSRQ
jgi:hypothetical protein